MPGRIIIVIALLLSNIMLSAQFKPGIGFLKGTDTEFVVFVTGLDPYILKKADDKGLDKESWSSIFRIYEGQKAPDEALGLPSMFGSYKINQNRIEFTPGFPLTEGRSYFALFNLPLFYSILNENIPDPKLLKILEKTHFIAFGHDLPNTKVVDIYPTSDTLPMNQLKFYVHFSSPMKSGEAYQHVHLINEQGSEEDASILEIPQELWNRERTRLTLFLDPGRIKRDLAPNLQMGAPLRQSEKYILQIDSLWKDKNGKYLTGAFTKEFFVVSPDRSSPDPNNWKIIVPLSSSKEKLQIHFSEPMDHALLQRMIKIIDKSKSPIMGEITTLEEERIWYFKPEDSWNKGDYFIDIDVNLEDLAGNNLRRVFDVDNLKDSIGSKRYHLIPFTIKR